MMYMLAELGICLLLLTTVLCSLVEVKAGKQHLGVDVQQNLPGVGILHLGVQHSDDLVC